MKDRYSETMLIIVGIIIGILGLIVFVEYQDASGLPVTDTESQVGHE